MLKNVTKDQFAEDGDNLKVTHVPTGQWFSSYAYDNPPDLKCPSHKGGLEVDRDKDGNDFSPEEIEGVATELLRDLLKRRS